MPGNQGQQGVDRQALMLLVVHLGRQECLFFVRYVEHFEFAQGGVERHLEEVNFLFKGECRAQDACFV